MIEACIPSSISRLRQTALAIVVSITLALVGCTTAGPTGPAVIKRTMSRDWSRLELTRLEGLRCTVNVGDVMTASKPLVIYPAVKLMREVTALTSHRGIPISVTLPVGAYKFERVDEQGTYFRSQAPLQIHYKGERKGFGGIYLPNGSSGQAAAYWFWKPPRIKKMMRKDIGVRVAYFQDIPPHLITKTIELPDDTIGFVTTLTYGGVAGGQIKFIYREYSDGLARMAFTQEVTLDYKPDQAYAYKNSRFTVHYADSIMIEYTLLQPL